MSTIKLNENEKTIDSWTLNYIPSFGGRYVGNLIITDKSVYFEADFSVELACNAVKSVEGGISFSREDIKSIKAVKKFWIFQRVEIELNDGTTHTFDRGVMSVRGIIDALGGEK
jgi:hypothetical protein